MRNLLTDCQIRALFDAALKEAGGVRALARRTNLSPAYISRVNNGAEPVAGRLASFLGMERVEGYRLVKAATTGETP